MGSSSDQHDPVGYLLFFENVHIMSTYLFGLLREFAGAVLSVRAHRQPEGRRSARRRLGVETLEDRLVPNATLPGPPGDAYVFAGQDSDPAGPIYHWSQPGGPGSHITLTYSYSNLLDGSMGAGLSPAAIKAAMAKLTPDDRRLAEAQVFCAIEEDSRLGAHGPVLKVMCKGQPVFVCCRGCEAEAKASPDQTLAKLQKIRAKVKTMTAAR